MRLTDVNNVKDSKRQSISFAATNIIIAHAEYRDAVEQRLSCTKLAEAAISRQITIGHI